MNIYFGAAGAGRSYAYHTGEKPDFYIDNDPAKWGAYCSGVRIVSPSYLEDKSNIAKISKIVITSGYVESIVAQLLLLEVPREKIVIPPKSYLVPHPFISEACRAESARFISSLMSHKAYNIVAGGGTALGFVRDGDFIRWDSDFDMFANINQKQAIIHLLQELGCKPFIESSSVKGAFTLKNDIVVPFSLDFFDDSSEIYHDRFEAYSWEWPISMFTEPKEITIHGCTINVPNPPEIYLEGVYGQDWRTPKQDFSYLDYGGSKDN